MEHLTRNFFLTLGLVAARLLAAAVIVGVTQSTKTHEITHTRVVRVQTTPPVQPVVYVTITPDITPAADGKLHDAYSVTNLYAKADQPVKLVVNNTDDVPHGVMAEAAGVTLVLKPRTHTFTFMVRKPGKYAWHCFDPCDPVSMAHMGYMRGFITARA